MQPHRIRTTAWSRRPTAYAFSRLLAFSNGPLLKLGVRHLRILTYSCEKNSMQLLEPHAPWLQNINVSGAGIAMGGGGRFGLGALLVVERAETKELLFARKTYRPGFEGNDQFTFPGGMIRPQDRRESMARWIQESLAIRVAAEVGLEFHAYQNMAPLEVTPPVVTAYIAKGRRRHTVILPFVLSMTQVFSPWTQDPTVYDPGWYSPVQVWREITPANRLIAAYYLWPRLSQQEQTETKPFLDEAFTQAAGAAAEVQLPTPAIPWAL